MSLKISHQQYVATYGPIVGDKVRLGDTELFAEVERDLLTYGDEGKFGGGKSIRDGMHSPLLLHALTRMCLIWLPPMY